MEIPVAPQMPRVRIQTDPDRPWFDRVFLDDKEIPARSWSVGRSFATRDKLETLTIEIFVSRIEVNPPDEPDQK